MLNNIPHAFRLLACATAILALAACHDDDEIRYVSPPNSGGPPAGPPGAGVTVAPVELQATTVGSVFTAKGDIQTLVPDGDGSTTFVSETRNASGFSLYVFDNDEVGDSSCAAGPCLTSWPPLMASDDDEAEEPFTIIERSDGLGKQWALRGKPLYLFANDQAPGDINGDGAGNNNWHLATNQPVLLSKQDNAAVANFGEFLVASGSVSNPDGTRSDKDRFTLYTFDNDEPGVSNCEGGCLTNWPPLLADTTDVAEAPYSLISRTIDGTSVRQWAYQGKPLYFNAQDTAPGLAGGANAANWRLARPMPFLAEENVELGSLIAGAGKVRTLASGEVADAGKDGFTLYTFDDDTAGQASTCEGGCAENWPPLIAHEGAEAEAPFSLVERNSGEQQWAINGWPLYFFNNDLAAAETKGEGAGGGKWHVARVAPVMASDDPEAGLLLAAHGVVDANGNPLKEGFTLYTFNNDTDGVSNCVDGCAENWPPLYAPDDAVGFGLFTVIDRSAGGGDGGDGGNSEEEQILLAGKQDYDAKCASCHGANGNGGTPINVSKFNEQTLLTKIEDTMPAGNAAGCVGQCALTTTAYILNGYSTQVEVEAPEPEPNPGSGGEDQILVQAKAEYDTRCAGCHGDQGQGNPGAGPNIDEAKFANNLAGLVTKILVSMPPANPGACDETCAQLTAAYILSGYTTGSAGDGSGTGQKQWAYKGKPLYFYSQDTQAGDTEGESVANWEIARP